MEQKIPTPAGIDVIKSNAGRGISVPDAHYDNFIDIAAHEIIRNMLERFKHGVVDKADVKKEFDDLKEWYTTFSNAYASEYAILAQDKRNFIKGKLDLTALNNAHSEREALVCAISALRGLTGDDLIGRKWTDGAKNELS